MMIDATRSIITDTRIFTIDSYLTAEQCDLLIDYIDNNTHRLIDRGKIAVNPGIRGEGGRYDGFLMCEELDGDIWREYFADRYINEIPLDSVMVNIYNEGDHIPPHRDKQTSLYTVSVPLQTSDNTLVFSEDIDSYYNNTTPDGYIFSDIKGIGYGFYGNSPTHWVPRVAGKRLSLICLYGSMTY
jgi:hypothetical protein